MLMVAPGKKRNELDLQKDVHYEIAELAKGKTYAQIAEDISKANGYSVSAVQVWKDCSKALVEWKRENMANIDAYIAKDLMRLEHLEQIVTENFEKSKLPRPQEYAALMKRGLTMEEIDEMYEERGGMAGDPRYLEVLLHIQKQRLDLLGIGKGNDVAQSTIVQYNFNGASLDQLAAIADNLQDGKKKEIDEQ